MYTHIAFSVFSPLLVNAQVVSVPGHCKICCYDHGSTDCLLEVLISFRPCVYPEVGLLDHLVVLFLSFLRNLYVIFHSGYIIYIPTNSAQEFPFLYILSSICYHMWVFFFLSCFLFLFFLFFNINLF